MRRRERDGSTRNEDFLARKAQYPLQREAKLEAKRRMDGTQVSQMDGQPTSADRRDMAHAMQIVVHPSRAEAILALKGGRIARCLLNDPPDIFAPVQTGFPEISKMVVAPDGAWIGLIGGVERTQTTPRIEFRAWEDLSLLRQLSPFEETIDDMTLSADGRWIAAVVGSGYVVLIDTETGRCVQEELGIGEYPIPCFAPNHPLLAISGGSHGGDSLQVYQIDSEGQFTLLGENVPGCYDDEYLGMVFSPDGQRLALLSTRDNGSFDWHANVTLYDPEDMAIEWAVTLNASTLGTPPWNNEAWPHPTGLRFHGDSEILYGTHHGHLIGLDRATGDILRNIHFSDSPRVHDPLAKSLDPRLSLQDPVAIALQADGARVWAVCYGGQLISVPLDPIPAEARPTPWPTLPRIRPTRTISPEGEEAYAVTLSPDGTQVLVFDAAYDEQNVQVLDSHTGERLFTLPTPGCNPKQLLYSPDGRYIAMDVDRGAERSNRLALWDAQTGAEVRTLPSSTPQLWFAGSRTFAHFHIAFAPNSRRVATSGGGQLAPLNIWNVETGELVYKIGQKIVSACFSHDGTRLVTTTNEREATLWDVERGEPIGEFGQKIVAAVFSSDGTRLVTSTDMQQVSLWNTVSGETMLPLTGESTPRTKLSLTFLEQDTKVLIIDEASLHVQIRDAQSGRQLQAFSLGSGQEGIVVVSPNGQSLAVLSGGPAVWDTNTETWIASSERNRNSFRPTLWDIASQTPLCTLTGHNSVSFLPNGTLQSCVAGGRLQIWDTNVLP